MKIGLALGSGASRGWSHIGVINALAKIGIQPDIICGTSIGSMVGASYAANNLEKLESWACSLSKFQTARFFDIGPAFNGFVDIEKLQLFLNEYVVSENTVIESFSKQYAAVATELLTGREVWFTEGPVKDAILASLALPGLFPAISHNNKWLVDGGLVNPVPVSVCRALGADIVIAVNLNGGIVGKHFHKPKAEKIATRHSGNGVVDTLSSMIKNYTDSIFTSTKSKNQPPGLFEAIAGSVNITQDRITRSRMAGDPPDILLTPRLSHIGLLEFYRAKEAIDEGKQCVDRMLSQINHVLDLT